MAGKRLPSCSVCLWTGGAPKEINSYSCKTQHCPSMCSVLCVLCPVYVIHWWDSLRTGYSVVGSFTRDGPAGVA